MAKKTESAEPENTVVIGAGADAPADAEQSASEQTSALKKFLVTLGEREPVQISAATVEDAIRAYNGDRTNYSRKQLTIVEG